MSYMPPPSDCPLCPRLAGFREANRIKYPSFFNAPVPSFGELTSELLIVGLAPGLKGANQTGRPFTGDYAGLVLYSALEKFGFAKGTYDPAELIRSHDQTGDGFQLFNCRITNAVRCVPQENKPEPAEIKTCNRFLLAEIAAMPNVKAFVTLGLIAHKAILLALGQKQSAFSFGHGAEHTLETPFRQLRLFNTYHCSRYNINTGRLTQTMFDDVVKKARSFIN